MRTWRLAHAESACVLVSRPHSLNLFVFVRLCLWPFVCYLCACVCVCLCFVRVGLKIAQATAASPDSPTPASASASGPAPANDDDDYFSVLLPAPTPITPTPTLCHTALLLSSAHFGGCQPNWLEFMAKNIKQEAAEHTQTQTQTHSLAYKLCLIFCILLLLLSLADCTMRWLCAIFGEQLQSQHLRGKHHKQQPKLQYQLNKKATKQQLEYKQKKRNT